MKAGQHKNPAYNPRSYPNAGWNPSPSVCEEMRLANFCASFSTIRSSSTTDIYYYYYYSLFEMEQTRTYDISEHRTITVYYKKEDGSVSIRIQDKYNDRRYADLTASRWAVLQSEIAAIDLALTNAVDNKDGVKLQRHLGFAWWVSVSSGFHCVDIRKFFIPQGEERQKPTRTGVTLAPREWNSLKELMPT